MPRHYNMTNRADAAAETRRRIVAAAAHLLAERDYHGVSMALVAERAEVARATVFNHFATKLDLVRAVEEELAQKMGVDNLPARLEGVGPQRAIDEALLANLSIWSASLKLQVQLAYVALSDEDLAEALSAKEAQRRQILTALADQLIKAGCLRRGWSREHAIDALQLISSSASTAHLLKLCGQSEKDALDLMHAMVGGVFDLSPGR
jgi:AcrR family transcriptional regulator